MLASSDASILCPVSAGLWDVDFQIRTFRKVANFEIYTKKRIHIQRRTSNFKLAEKSQQNKRHYYYYTSYSTSVAVHHGFYLLRRGNRIPFVLILGRTPMKQKTDTPESHYLGDQPVHVVPLRKKIPFSIHLLIICRVILCVPTRRSIFFKIKFL